ncbi:MAG: 2-hydroxychromene-2-carboxylate isomerase [Deltaproteobacteria bacterium]|nr:2-hydroxychromene-2-carboxylate isomerase [Deltaproteobacteria bacterium]
MDRRSGRLAPVLELWFDFSCPYAYLASRRAARLGVPIDWRPMLLGGVFRGTGAGAGPMATLSAAKARHNLLDMQRWADLFGEPFRIPASHPMRTVRALRVLLALPHSRWPAAIEALYAAYWQRGEDVTADEVIAATLRLTGIPDDEVTRALEHGSSDVIKQELHRRTDEAIALGVFGAPAWILRRPDPLLIWGQDRFSWLEAALAGWDPEAGPPPGGPRPLVTTGRARPGATVDVYFDVASPFAYLGLTQLPALAAMGVKPRLVPILLGALFREIGQADVPLLTFPPAKARYVMLDMARWARWWGVPFDQPTRFPQRTVTAQRLALLAAARGFEPGIAMAIALGRAMWAEQRDLADDQTLRELLVREGFPPAWLEQTQTPAIKAELAANTAAARAAGVFGVPTFVVGEELFWGQDRLELVARELAK